MQYSDVHVEGAMGSGTFAPWSWGPGAIGAPPLRPQALHDKIKGCKKIHSEHTWQKK